MKRRQILCRGFARAGSNDVPLDPNSPARSRSLPFDLATSSQSKHPAILRLAEEVREHCVLAKINPPEGTLRRCWLNSVTGDAPFYGYWISRGIRRLRLYPSRKLFPDPCQPYLWLVRNALWFPSTVMPIPAVVLVAFNLVQDGVNPASGLILVCCTIL